MGAPGSTELGRITVWRGSRIRALMRRSTDLRRSGDGHLADEAPLAARRLAAAGAQRGTARALLELACMTHGEDWDESTRHIVQLDAEVIRVERVSFWSLRNETSRIHCDAGYVASSGAFEHGATLLRSNCPAYFDAILEARIVRVEDVYRDPRVRDLHDYCAARRISSMLDIPVWLDGRLAGVLCHEHVGAKRRWSAGDEDFAIGVGQVMASALAVRARTRAEATMRRAEFLDNVCNAIMQSLDTGGIASRVLDLVVPKLADFAMIWARHGGVFEGIGAAHADPRMNEVVTELMHAATTARVPGLIHQGQSLLVPNASPSALKRYGVPPAQRARFARLGLRTAMVVPLATAGKTLGAMAFFAGHRHYGSDDLALAEGIGRRVAAALVNARLYQVARDAIHARDDFLVLAAHELRTPLTALQLMADRVLRRGRDGARAGDTVGDDALARQVRRLSALVERMLDALHIRAEGLSVALGSCDLSAIAKNRVEERRKVAPRPKCAITVGGEPAVVGHWDRARVAQLVDELLGNAIKFGGGKPIEVTVGRDTTDAVLTVRDHGIGIPADRLSAIFSPFERSVPKENFGGLGLGLFIAKAIVEAHRGSIVATSHPGEGTAIVVRLPLTGETAGTPPP